MTDAARRIAIPLVLLCSGCAAAALPQRYPNRPPAGMSAAQAEQGERACVDAAAHATVERAWTYIGCMVSKGHDVGVAFRVHGETTYLYVTQTRLHEPAVVAYDLNDCRNGAYTAGRSERGSTQERIVERMETTFRACVEPLGYTVRREATSEPVRPGR